MYLGFADDMIKYLSRYCSKLEPLNLEELKPMRQYLGMHKLIGLRHRDTLKYIGFFLRSHRDSYTNEE